MGKGGGLGLPETERAELFVRKQMSLVLFGDLGAGRDTEASDYIRIKYVACSSLGRCLLVLSTGEFLCFEGDGVFTQRQV